MEGNCERKIKEEKHMLGVGEELEKRKYDDSRRGNGKRKKFKTGKLENDDVDGKKIIKI